MIFATANNHKVLEVRAMLGENWEIQSLNDLGFDQEIPETGSTLQENAFIKADTIFKKYFKAVFADDTGLAVDVLMGQPGVYSARYAGENATYENNCNKLLREMSGFTDRNAKFITVFCLILSKKEVMYFEGEVAGTIANEPRGKNGFGYDSLFIPNGCQSTFAEMSAEEKNSMSHRKVALTKLTNYLLSLNQY